MKNRPLRSALALVVGLLGLSAASSASADEPANSYCRKVVAQSEGDAALLMGPSVIAQAIRFPAGAIADSTGVQVGHGWQPRVAASVGLLDIYKGVGVLEVGQADCRRELASEELHDLVDLKDDVGRSAALGRELEVFHRRLPEVEELVANAEKRLLAGLTTVGEVTEMRRKALDLDRKAAQAEGDLASLRQRDPRSPSRPILDLLADYDAKALSYDERITHVRNLDPWRLNVQGGAVATPTADYFAVVELSYNFGGLVRSGANGRFLDARRDELKDARYELHTAVVRMLGDIRASVAEMERERTALDRHLATLATRLSTLKDGDAPNAPEVLAHLRIESIELEADRAYLAALIAERAALISAPTAAVKP